MSKSIFTPASVVDEIANYNLKRSRGKSDFMMFDPDFFSAGWSQQEKWQRAEELISDYYEWRNSPIGHSIWAWEMLYYLSTVRAIHLAKSGHLSPIYARLRISGLPLSQEERHILADRGEGKFKFKRGRKNSNSAQVYLFMSLWFHMIEGESKYNSKIRTEKFFNVSESHVYAMLRRIKGTQEEAKIYEMIQICSDNEFMKVGALKMIEDLFRK